MEEGMIQAQATAARGARCRQEASGRNGSAILLLTTDAAAFT